MNTPLVKRLRLFAPAILVTALVACGLFQPPAQPTQQPQFTDLPSAIPNAAVASITPEANASVSPGSRPITLRFTAPMNASGVEAAFSFLPGVYTTNIGTQKLTLTAMCNGRWRVRNPSASTVVFTWDVFNTTQKGSGIAPGNADVFFTTTPGQKTVRVFVGGALHNTKAANTNACTTTIPAVPGRLPGTFAWTTPSEVVFTPAQPLSSDQAYSVFLALETPFASPFQTLDTLAITGAGIIGASSLSNDRDGELGVYGKGFSGTTSFFLQSNRLEVLTVNPFYAKLKIPAGFLPSTYGLMAANPDGVRATLYPALQIVQGAVLQPLDPQRNARGFVEGYVTDYATGSALKGATVSLNSATGTLNATSDASGYYLIRGVPSGRQSFRIEKSGYEPVWRIANITQPAESYALKLAALEPISPRVTEIGAAGGTHYATDAGATGPYLQIPAGALESTVPIQFTQLRDASTLPQLPQDGSFLAFAHLGPTGLTFKKPATLFLPLQAGISIPIGTRINIFYFDAKRAEWVDDITSGKISNVGGKLYLEYEINHFTWIGGTWLPDEVTGCVRYPNGSRARGVQTNWGISDSAGLVIGTTTRSDIGRTLTLSAIGRPGSTVSTVQYTGNGTASFPCITVPATPYVPVKWTPEPVGPISPYVPDPGNPPPPPPDPCNPASPSKPIKGFSERALEAVGSAALRPQAEPNTASILVTADSLYGFTANIPDWTGGNVDPSSIKLEIGGVDYTGKADFVYPSPTVPGAMQVKLALSEPLRAKAGLEVKLSGVTREGEAQGAATTLDVVARIAVAPIRIIKLPEYDDLIDEVTTPTPVSLFQNGAVTVIYREGDSLNNLKIELPVFALNEIGEAVNISNYNISLDDLTGASVGGSTQMIAGAAAVLITVNSSNPNTFGIAISGVKIEVVSSTLNATNISTNRIKPQFVPLIIGGVVVLTAAETAIVAAGTAVAGWIWAQPKSVTVDYNRWVNNGDEAERWQNSPKSIPILRPGQCPLKPIVIRATETKAGDVPFLITKPIALNPDFNNCKDQLPNWKPPRKGTPEYDNAAARIASGRTDTMFDNIDLSVSVKGMIAPLRGYPSQYGANKIISYASQVQDFFREFKLGSGSVEKILTSARANALNIVGQAKPTNVSIYGHMHSLWQSANNIANRIRNLGENGKFKSSPKICFSEGDLDSLSVMLDKIMEILEFYNKPW